MRYALVGPGREGIVKDIGTTFHLTLAWHFEFGNPSGCGMNATQTSAPSDRYSDLAKILGITRDAGWPSLAWCLCPLVVVNGQGVPSSGLRTRSKSYNNDHDDSHGAAALASLAVAGWAIQTHIKWNWGLAIQFSNCVIFFRPINQACVFRKTSAFSFFCSQLSVILIWCVLCSQLSVMLIWSNLHYWKWLNQHYGKLWAIKTLKQITVLKTKNFALTLVILGSI